ncbi:hypothetical protein LBMAG42_41200 [Deltaproteobacteria bacterium]|nr:hypothetical protein LBMAG42_41200 [Deltaproteobacteria bacterium]
MFVLLVFIAAAPTASAQDVLATTEIEPAAAEPSPPPDRGPGAHLRFGLGADLAALGATDFFGLGVGVQARLGVQLSPWFAVYYQPHAIGGLVLTGDSSAGALGALFNSANVELDLPILQVGAGPSVDVLALAGCSLGTATCNVDNGTYFGVDVRAALLIGPHGPGTHSGFAIEANLHPTFLDTDVLTTFTLGFAGEIY